MAMTIGLRLDPVCHEGVWDGTRPWPHPWPVGRGPNGADDRAPDEGTEKKKIAVDGRCLIIYLIAEDLPHLIQ